MLGFPAFAAAVEPTVPEVPATAVAPAAPAQGCPVPASAAGGDGRMTRHTLVVDGLERSYLLALPARRPGARPWPLLLAFHGYSSSAARLASTSRITVAGAAAGFVTVLPDGSGTPTRWALPGGLPGADDVAFVRQLLRTVRTQACVDLRRVYAAGFSNGAAFAGLLTCRHPTLFAGVAMVGGANLAPACAAHRAAPMMRAVLVHSTDDRVVPLRGGLVLGGTLRAESFRTTVARWRADGTRRVAVRTVSGAGHRWPSLATEEIVATFGE